MQALTRLARPVLARPLCQTPRCVPSPGRPIPPTLQRAPFKLIAPSRRTFITLSPLRPSLTPLLRPALTSFTPTPTTTSATGDAVADLVPRTAISSHPALGGIQIRCGPRNTMNGHTRLIQKRRHGFLYRMKTKTGRRILQRRRIKGRRQLAQ